MILCPELVLHASTQDITPTAPNAGIKPTPVDDGIPIGIEGEDTAHLHVDRKAALPEALWQ